MTRRREKPPTLAVGRVLGNVVRAFDGRTFAELAEPRALPDLHLYVTDVAGAVRRIGDRPLERWRYWHRRFQLVRAHRKPRSLFRDPSGLYDIPQDDDADVTEAGLARLHDAILCCQDWCLAHDIKPGTSAGGIGIALLESPRFAPRFPPLWACLADEEAIKPALYGGRCEVFRDHLDASGRYQGGAVLYDVNGAYLDVIRSVPLPYPYRYIAFPNLKAEGVTDCTIRETAKFPVLPLGSSKNFPQGVKRGTWTNREIRYAIECGAQLLRVHGGLHYVKRTRALQPLGDYLAEERERETHPVIRGLLKKIPNAMIGRFAATPSYCVTRTGKEWKRAPGVLSGLQVTRDVASVELRAGRRSPWYAVAWSAAILAEQRIRLHQAIESFDRNGYHVLYADTDGIMLGLAGRSMTELPPSSSAIGEWKVEWASAFVRIAGPKAYVARLADGAQLVRRAGVPREIPNRLELDPSDP